jgi:hypothetical protein
MTKTILSLFLLIYFSADILAQDVFFKTGRNFTTYEYRNNNGLKPIEFIPRVGASFEIGMGFPFLLELQKDILNPNDIKIERHRFRNEVSFMLNSYNAFGGDPNNNYTYEATFGGIKNQFSFLAQAGKLELGLLMNIGINKLLSGTQVINNSRFSVKAYDEFKNVFLQTGLGASAAYPLFDNAFLTVAYNYTVNRRPQIQNTAHVNFNSRLVLFGIHFKID